MSQARHIQTLVFSLVAISAPFHVEAQPVAFDIGQPESHYIYCQDDGLSWERFPPYPFGDFPAGSIVFASLERVDCGEISGVDGVCVGAFIASFDDGGCGCNGSLVEATDLELHYDMAAVEAARVNESTLKLLVLGRIAPGWAEVPGSSVDVAKHAVRGQGTGFIIGQRFYAIVGTPSTSVESTTWGAVKSLWR